MCNTILSQTPQISTNDLPAPDAALALEAARNARALALDALRRAAAEFYLLAESYQTEQMISHMLARRAECDAAADALELTGGAS